MSDARVGSGLLVVIPVIFSMIVMLELVLGGGVRWLPNIDAVILAPVLLSVFAEAKRGGAHPELVHLKGMAHCDIAERTRAA